MNTKPLRVFRNYFQCDACPNEWTNEALVIGPDWCPSCDGSVEPYSSEAMFDPDLATYDTEAEEVA